MFKLEKLKALVKRKLTSAWVYIQVFVKWVIIAGITGIIGGGILAYARGLGEFGATAMLAGNIAGQTRTLPMAVYSEVAAGNMGDAFNYVVVIVIIAFIAIFVMDYVSIRKEKQWR